MKVSIVFYLQENHIKIDNIIFLLYQKNKNYLWTGPIFFITVETSEIFDFFSAKCKRSELVMFHWSFRFNVYLISYMSFVSAIMLIFF